VFTLDFCFTKVIVFFIFTKKIVFFIKSFLAKIKKNKLNFLFLIHYLLKKTFFSLKKNIFLKKIFISIFCKKIILKK